MSQPAVRHAVVLAVVAVLTGAGSAYGAFGDRPLESGDRGQDVRVLQSWLTRLGFPTTVDGAFGELTARAVYRYERENGLKRDRKVSRAQARRMRRQVEGEGAGARRTGDDEEERVFTFGERALRRGDRGRDVRVLQSWLARLGIPTEVDGAFGARTEANVRSYDEWNGLRVNGEVSRSQARLMRRQVEEGMDLPATPPPGGGDAKVETSGSHVFPVQGTHRYGDGLGAGRGHRGVDVFAECRTPLVAAQGGEVDYAGYNSSAGYDAVINGAESGQDYIYMHMSSAPLVKAGDTVQTGQQIGTVGETGNASGCHLHFELWSGPGWYKGGDFLDPLPALRSWDGQQ
ncbi:peptidoglycan-binding protein [Thermoleophilum album]|uniref:Murein DD-endopeptidase MepM and murein hydrolase activator NlpD, contain LysM domain n=1 Tax=Thermoleophilum album TaxID=29539 RepID=A0A1H6FZM3_THEAL|nr:peptidoglycan-binding protein [Thermoleophilum album]SEH16279.1 Murein DD-endopeptidase MepM and murein hydrolase activator NlpD, contain LysM domain [Thermoleophilum album]